MVANLEERTAALILRQVLGRWGRLTSAAVAGTIGDAARPEARQPGKSTHSAPLLAAAKMLVGPEAAEASAAGGTGSGADGERSPPREQQAEREENLDKLAHMCLTASGNSTIDQVGATASSRLVGGGLRMKAWAVRFELAVSRATGWGLVNWG